MITSCLIHKKLLKELKLKSQSSKKEVCGFIKEGEFIEKNNYHPDPENFFLIDPTDCIFDENVVVFHSHPDHVLEKGFSEWDLENQHYFQMDMLLYSVNNNKFYFKKNDICNF